MLDVRLFVALALFVLVSPLLAPLQAQSDRDRLKAEIVIRTEHGGWSGGVDSVAMSHNERWGLTGGDSVKVWEIETGRLIRTLEAGGLGIIHAIAVSGDDKYVVAAGKHAVMWSIETGVIVRKFEGNKSNLRSIKFAVAGNRIIAGENDGFVSVWDTASGSLVKRFKAHGGTVAALAVAPDGSTFLSADENPILGSGKPDGKIRRWNLTDFSVSRTYEGGGAETYAIAFTPDGRYVVAAGNDEKIHIWGAETGSLVRSLQDGEFKNGNRAYKSLSITADSKTILAAGYDNRLQLWDLAQGKLLNSFDTQRSIADLAASASGTTVLLSPGAFAKWVGVFDTKAGKYVGALTRGNAQWLNGAITSADFRYIYYTTEQGILGQIDLRSGQRRTLWKAHDNGFTRLGGLSISPDGRHLAARVNDVGLLVDTATGSVGMLGSEFLSSTTVFGSATAFTPDGKRVVLSSGSNLSIFDVATRSHLRDLFVVKPKFDAGGDDKSDQTESTVQSDGIAITPDGRTIASSHFDGRVRIWDIQTGRLLRTIVAARGWYGPGEEDRDGLGPILILPDGRSVAVSVNFGRGNKNPAPIRLFEIGTGRQIGELKDKDAPYRAMSMASSVDGARLVAGHFNGFVSVWDLKSRLLVNQQHPHRGYTETVSIHKDQRTVLSASVDGTMNVARIDTGESVARILMDEKDQWIAATGHGFITASSREVFRLASVVRGMKTYSILQVYDSVYNPDLVMETLAGDPNGEVKRALERFNLDRQLDSGTPPTVKVSTRTLAGHTPFENGNVTAEVVDMGGGIGRVEWRVNGVIAGVDYPGVAKGGTATVLRKLNFDAGNNKIEVRAYNGTNQFASTAASAEINSLRLLPAGKPRLHILAIGINAYEDKGGDGFKGFEPLQLAVSDAKAVGAELARAGRELYAGDLNVVVLTDREATRSGIATAVERMAEDIHPRDTFILFAAAHGISPDGRFYLIPQDYQGGANPASLKDRAIGQDLLQDWLANKIRAKRAVVLLDTCASGALVSGHLRSRLEAGTSDASVGRLHEATGRAVLTAAAEGRPAWEGHEGRGLFTHALLDALRKGDANKDGVVSLSELAAHIQTTVPKLAAGVDAKGAAGATGTKGSKADTSAIGTHGENRGARVVARFAGSSSAEKLEQSSRFGSRGEDFPLARVLP